MTLHDAVLVFTLFAQPVNVRRDSDVVELERLPWELVIG